MRTRRSPRAATLPRAWHTPQDGRVHTYRRVHGIFRMQRTRGTHTTRHTYIRVQPGPTRGYAHEYRVRHAPALTAATNGLWAGGAGRQ